MAWKDKHGRPELTPAPWFGQLVLSVEELDFKPEPAPVPKATPSDLDDTTAAPRPSRRVDPPTSVADDNHGGSR